MGGSRQHNIQFMVLRSYKDFNPKIDTIDKYYDLITSENQNLEGIDFKYELYKLKSNIDNRSN